MKSDIEWVVKFDFCQVSRKKAIFVLQPREDDNMNQDKGSLDIEENCTGLFSYNFNK